MFSERIGGNPGLSQSGHNLLLQIHPPPPPHKLGTAWWNESPKPVTPFHAFSFPRYFHRLEYLLHYSSSPANHLLSYLLACLGWGRFWLQCHGYISSVINQAILHTLIPQHLWHVYIHEDPTGPQVLEIIPFGAHLGVSEAIVWQ